MSKSHEQDHSIPRMPDLNQHIDLIAGPIDGPIAAPAPTLEATTGASLFNRTLATALAITAIAGGLVAGEKARAQSAPQAEAVISTLFPEIVAKAQPVPEGSKAEMLTPKKAIEYLKSNVSEDEIKSVSVAQSGKKLSIRLSQIDRMSAIVLGSIYTEKYYPGAPGIQSGYGRENSKFFPYLLSPDLISRNTVKVQAFTKNATTGKWKSLSGAVMMPQFDNYSATAMETTPPGGESLSVEEPSVAGYDLGPQANRYERTHVNKGKLSLHKNLTASERKRNGFYVKVTQRWQAVNNAYSPVQQGVKTGYYGPFTKAKQATSAFTGGKYQARNK